MDFEEFRKHGHVFVDWMADYLEGIEDYPVRARVRPGDIAAQLPDAPPQAGESMEDIFADFQRIVLPGISHWQHPRWMAYFPASSSPPSVLAEMLTATLATNCMLWETSPRRYRDGDPGPRLAAPDDRPAERLCRGDTGYRLVCHLLRYLMCAGEGHRRVQQQRRAGGCQTPGLLHLSGRPFFC